MRAGHSASSRSGSAKDCNPCTHRQRKRSRGVGLESSCQRDQALCLACVPTTGWSAVGQSFTFRFLNESRSPSPKRTEFFRPASGTSGPSLNPQSRTDSSNLRFSRGAEAPRRGLQDEQSRSPGAAPGLPDDASVHLSDHRCRKAPRNTDASSPETSSSFFLVFRILSDLRYSAAAATTGSLCGSVPCSASLSSSTTSGLIRNHAA
jgi:hypothetical protein